MSKNSIASKPSFLEALKFWFKLGWISFGGTVGHINIMHEELVTRRKWISNTRFFHALSLCMLLPGPEAQQLAIYIGWQLHGKRGGLVAGILFFLPSLLILLLLSILYVKFGNQPWMFAMFKGFKPAVISIIIAALLGIGKKALKSSYHVAMALIAFLSILLFNVAMPIILLLAVVTGTTISKMRNKKQINTPIEEPFAPNEHEYYFNSSSIAEGKATTQAGTTKQCLLFILLWLTPILLIYLLLPDFSFWKQLSLFFTQTALLTIGGSYTVLPYVAQFSVMKLGWLSKLQMIDGFALAETTPGPLIIVVCYVGFIAAYNHFSGSIGMGAIGLLLTAFNTFLPSFLFIFAGGPIIEKTHGNNMISQVLGFVTASVVGVILNLTLFLGKEVIFRDTPSLKNMDWFALGWIILTLIAMKKFNINVLQIISLSLVFGLVHYYFWA